MLARGNDARTFQLPVQYPYCSAEYYLDNTIYTCDLSFINHHCNPNARFYAMTTEEGWPVIAIYAIKNIPANTFIGMDYWNDQDIITEEELPNGCFCGYVHCKFRKTK